MSAALYRKRITTVSPGAAPVPLTRLVVEEPRQRRCFVPRTYGPSGKVVRRTPICLILFCVHSTGACICCFIMHSKRCRPCSWGQRGGPCSWGRRAVRSRPQEVALDGPTQQGSPPCDFVKSYRYLVPGPGATVTVASITLAWTHCPVKPAAHGNQMLSVAPPLRGISAAPAQVTC